MAYVVPTPDMIKAVAREFADVDPAYIALVIEQAMLFVDESWSEQDYKWAIIYLVAHLLKVSGADEAVTGGAADDPTTFVSMIAFGDRRVQFRKATSGQMEVAVASGDYDTTRYGGLFLALRRRNFPAIAIV